MRFKELKKMGRFKEIATTMIKYGFDEFVDRIDLPDLVFIQKIYPVEKEMNLYARIRRAMEELGPTFVKFGQIMSLRPDLLPGELLYELEKLQDDVPPSNFGGIESIIESSLGRPVKKVFSVFDVEPMAAASLSQVHRAVLRDEGHIVAVKVQRPGIRRKIASDLDIMEGFFEFLHHKFEDVKTYALPTLVEEIRSQLMKEIDFTVEARNMQIARANARETPVYIPKVYDNYSSEKLLVMELIQGAKLKDVVPGTKEQAKRLALQGLDAAIKQILEDGIFHADPHPGNLLVNEEMNLCIIDWGMVGRLTEKDRFELMDLLKAVVDKDSEAIIRTLLCLCETGGKTISPRIMERDLLDILDNYYAVPIKEMDIGQLLMSLSTLIRNQKLQLPMDLVVMIKALVTAEGSARQVYPELDVVSETRDEVYRIAKKRYKPEVLWRSARNAVLSLWASQRNMPRQFKQIIGKLDTGQLELRFRMDKLEQLIHSLETASNRLTAGIITGAIIIGSSMIITTGTEPHLFGFPALGVVGYLMSVVLGLWLVFTMLRIKKR